MDATLLLRMTAHFAELYFAKCAQIQTLEAALAQRDDRIAELTEQVAGLTPAAEEVPDGTA